MRLGWTTVLAMGILLLTVSAEDQWTVAEGNESMMVAIGCFWCVEQAFEQYGPGVVEVISGYAGGELENPSESGAPMRTSWMFNSSWQS